MLAGLKRGWQKAAELMTNKGDYGHTILPTKEGRAFYRSLGEAGIDASKPAELAGALGARLLTDIGGDESRKLYWRYNHPMAITEKLAEKGMGDNISLYSAPQKAAIGLAAVGVPVSASLGVYDITNPGELGRPKGFAQTYAEQGSEDRRQTGQVGPELVDRFVLGRQGRPLKFATAQEDIPNLTKKRYSNYMNYLYNDKGPLGAGIVKGTMENLEGVPEARIVGFPIGLQAAGAIAGGVGTTGAILRNMQTPMPDAQGVIRKPTKPPVKARTVALAGAGGAVLGALAGKFANTMLAAEGNPELPSTYQYDVAKQIVPERTFNGATPEGELVMAAIRGYGPYKELEQVGLNTPEKLEQRRQELMQLDTNY